jgi:hypothetical protein
MESLNGVVILQQIGLAALKMALIAVPLLTLIAFIDRVLNFMPWSIPFQAPGHLLRMMDQHRNSDKQQRLPLEPERMAIEA